LDIIRKTAARSQQALLRRSELNSAMPLDFLPTRNVIFLTAASPALIYLDPRGECFALSREHSSLDLHPVRALGRVHFFAHLPAQNIF
jgi:hypothetical protein